MPRLPRSSLLILLMAVAATSIACDPKPVPNSSSSTINADATKAEAGTLPAGAANAAEPFEPRIPAEISDDPLGEEKPTHFTWLEQNWTAAETQEFYLLPHGSQLVPYSWFKELERPADGKPFRSNENLARFRFLPQRVSAGNPDGLPVGFVKDGNLDWVGLNCAACHTNQINFRKTAIRIEGGPAAIDLDSFVTELTAALDHTLNTADVFKRFAGKILGPSASANDVARLKLRLGWVTQRRKDYNQRNLTGPIPAPETARAPWGHYRIDAFGAILNQVTSLRLHVPKNAKVANAPVSIPFLWDTPQHTQVQWNGAATNSKVVGLQLGSLGRNGGEVLGVFGELRIDTDGIWPGYESSLRFQQLQRAETLVTTLWSPKWPETIMDHKLTQTKVDQGRVLYREKKCVMCHFLIQRDDPTRKRLEGDPDIKSLEKMVGISPGDAQHAVRTDPLMAINFATDRSTGDLNGVSKTFIPGINKFGDTASTLDILGHVVMGAIIYSPFNEERELKPEVGEAHLEAAQLKKYKARPLNGIWATAPYLHNGSVPTLWHLLSAERPKVFAVGDREYDVDKVGFKVSTKDLTPDEAKAARQRGLSVIDTTIPGNKNHGHIYGVESFDWKEANGDVKTIKPLEGEEREALLEFLRSL